jgi:predicted lysophospholipase L1 biosynthesis ABC-type transport system permease subunit
VLYLLYALLALAIVIAILDVINTLALSVIERTREISLLRAIGGTRLQVRRLVRLESVLVAVHGALAGLALGLAWGIAGQKVLTAYGVTALTIPWPTIAVVLTGAAFVGFAAAILPAYRAARMNTLTAIATEWPVTPMAAQPSVHHRLGGPLARDPDGVESCPRPHWAYRWSAAVRRRHIAVIALGPADPRRAGAARRGR